MVLGPNGTGKSALVCAMIVGLAGDASTTGRAGTMAEYVKFGCDFATTEIELYNPGGNYVIERKIVKKAGRTSGPAKCSSEWKINNLSSTQTEVRALIASLNIRVNNLCQFLPQERVVEFCRMNPQDLLENTEKAAGDEQMFKDHEALKELSKAINDINSEKTRLEKQLIGDESEKNRMADEVERVRQWKKYGDQLLLLKKKKPWLEYVEAKKQLEDVQKSLSKLEGQLFKQKQKNVPLEKQVQAAQSSCTEKDTIIKSMTNTCNNLQTQIIDLERNLTISDSKIASILGDLESKKEAEEKRLEELTTIREQISMMKNNLSNFQDTDVTEDLAKLTKEYEAADKVLQQNNEIKEDISTQKESLTSESTKYRAELNWIENTFRGKMNLLKHKSPDAYSASLWLQENRSQFNKDVFLPIFTQINVKKPEWVAVVESAIPFRDLTAFVCEDSDDWKKFSHAMKDKGIRVNILQAPTAGSFRETPNMSITNLERFGFSKYIADLFTAPPAIMRYLCRNFNLQNTPVGDDNVKAEEFLNSGLNFNRFFCGKTSYTVSVSRYDNQKVSSMDPTKNPDLLNIIVDTGRKQELGRKIKEIEENLLNCDEQLTALEEELVEQRSKLNELNIKKRELFAKRDERKILETKLSAKEDAIVRKEREKIDLDQEKNKAGQRMNQAFEQRIKQIAAMNKLISELVQANHTKLSSTIARNFAKKREEWYKSQLDSANLEFASLEAEITDRKSIRDRVKMDTNQKLLHALGVIGTNERQLPAAVEKKFRKLPNTLEEIDSEIRQLNLRVESMGLSDNDLRILEEYEDTAQKIEQTKVSIQQIDVELNEKNCTLETIKHRWLPPLNLLINRIDKNFSTLMGRLGCAGQISLATGENEVISTCRMLAQHLPFFLLTRMISKPMEFVSK